MSNLTLYNSSAGSGKTYTLVKEYLKKTLNDDYATINYYKHILAVTFTNKAAAEMKHRVINALKEIASKKKLEGTTAFLLVDLMKPKTEGGLGLDKNTIEKRCNLVLRSMLHNYNDLSISTIDKFTHKIIRTFANDLHLPLNFEIDLDEKEILSKAVDLLIAQTGKDEEFTKLLINFSLEKADNEKSWEIENDLKNFAYNLLKDNNEFYLNQLSHLSINDFNLIRKKLILKIKDFEEEVCKLAKNNLKEIKTLKIEHASFYSSYLPKYYQKIITDPLFTPNNTILSIISGEKDWYSKTTNPFQKQLIDENKSLFVQQFNSLQNFITTNTSNYITNKYTRQYSYTLAVLNEIEKIIQEVKKDNNVLNFSDFNKKIAQIIANEPTPFIYERLGEKYHHYFIDEFQDTSIIQWKNLLPLVDNALANNYFNMLVGDAKQSIYRFRGGEVEQIINLPNIIVTDYNKKNETFVEIEKTLQRNFHLENLTTNYRSKAEIVNFNNNFFQSIAKHLPKKYNDLYVNLNQNFNENNNGGSVSITFIEHSKKEDLDSATLQEIINTITNLLEDDYQLKDIAILTRKRPEGVAIASHLIENGINVISSESLLLKNSKEVQFLIQLFNYQLTPNNKEIELFIIQFLIENKNLNTNLFDMFSNYTKNSFHQFLIENNLALNNNFINKLSLYELTEYFINHFQLDKEINIYLQFFLEKVYEYSSKRGNSTSNFIDWWNEKSDNFTIVIPEGINAIKVMTIHKSKGLEFPVVIYPFANTPIITQGKVDYFWTTNTNVEGLNAALLPIKSDLLKTIHSNVYSENIEKLTLDLINLLYVALTRPEERLYIISSVTSDKKNDKPKTKLEAINEYLLDFCQQTFLTKIDETKYTHGNFNKKCEKENTTKNNDKTEVETFSIITHNSWREKIKISYQAPKTWNVDSPESIGQYGTLIHSILAELKNKNELDFILNKYENKGILSFENKNELKTQLNKILNNPLIAHIYSDVDSIKNEQALLIPSSENYNPDKVVYKPDRVVYKENTIYIIDYKTGEKTNKHITQIENYKKILLSMHPSKAIKSYLLYINTSEVFEA